jgi:hypothetical protein
VKEKRKGMWVWLVVRGDLEANDINVINWYQHLLGFDNLFQVMEANDVNGYNDIDIDKVDNQQY